MNVNVSAESGWKSSGESSDEYVRGMVVLNGLPEDAEVSSMRLATPTCHSHYAVFDFDADEDSEEDQNNDLEQPDDVVVSSSSIVDSSPYLDASFHEHDVGESPYSIVRQRDESWRSAHE